jgi:hypothetical protein
MQDSTSAHHLSSHDEMLAAVHFHNRTEHAVSFPLGLARPLVRATTPAHRKRPQRKLKMGEVEHIEPLAPALCGGGGAPTSWLVGFLADPLSDRVGRLLGPPSLYGAHTGPFSAGRCATSIADGRRGTAECRCTRPVCWLRQRRVSDAVKWAQIGKKAVASIEQ